MLTTIQIACYGTKAMKNRAYDATYKKSIDEGANAETAVTTATAETARTFDGLVPDVKSFNVDTPIEDLAADFAEAYGKATKFPGDTLDWFVQKCAKHLCDKLRYAHHHPPTGRAALTAEQKTVAAAFANADDETKKAIRDLIQLNQ